MLWPNWLKKSQATSTELTSDILQRAATKVLKQCHGGDVSDGRGKACLDILDEARREFIEDIPAAKERDRQWHESVAKNLADDPWPF